MTFTITDRQKTVFEAIVREYIHGAEPVSSASLVEKLKLPFSPATVRNEMAALDDKGLIFQPHTSAGRIPTNKGYRFFIECGIMSEQSAPRIKRAFAPLRDIDGEFDFLRQASRMLAELSGEFSIAGMSDMDLSYKCGMAGSLRSPEFADENHMREFSELADMLDDELKQILAQDFSGEPMVFIGEENPIREAQEYTMMVARAHTPFDEESVFAILGPRRMDYEKNILLLKTLKNLFD